MLHALVEVGVGVLDDEVLVGVTGMFHVEVLLARDLVGSLLDVLHDVRDDVLWQTLVLAQDIVELWLGVARERASQVRVTDGFGTFDDLGAAVWRIRDASWTDSTVVVSMTMVRGLLRTSGHTLT